MAIQPVQDIVKFIATTIHFRSKYLSIFEILICLFVTGFAKTRHNSTRIEIHFIA